MNVEPQREELHRLVDELPAREVPAALAALKARREKRPASS